MPKKEKEHRLVEDEGGMTTSAIHANKTGSGIENYDPLLCKHKKKKLRDILQRDNKK